MSPVLHEALYDALALFVVDYSTILAETLKTNRKPLHYRKYRVAAHILQILHEKWEQDLPRQVQIWAKKAKADLKQKDLLAIRLVLGVFYNWDITKLGKGRMSAKEQELVHLLRKGGLNLTDIGRLLLRDPRTIQANLQKR